MYRHTLYLSFFLLLFSCTTKTNTHDKANENSFKSFEIDINAKEQGISEFIASVEFVVLEESDSSYLNRVENLLIDEEGSLYFYNEGGKSIHVFNESGAFQRRFSSAGKGPGEYSVLTNFWMEGDTIVIYSRIDAAIYRYSKVGEFIEREELPFRAGYMNSFEGGYGLEMNYNLVNDSLKYRYAILDSDLSLKEAYLPYDEVPDIGNAPGVNSVMAYKDEVLLFRMMSDTVYHYGAGGFQPFIHFNFANDWFWKGKAQPEQKDFMQIPNSGKVWELATSVGEDLVYLKGFVAYDGWEHFLINRKTGQVIHLNIGLDHKQAFNMVNLGWFDGRLAMAFSGGTAIDFLSLLGNDQIAGAFSREELLAMESENPIICFIKFKADF